MASGFTFGAQSAAAPAPSGGLFSSGAPASSSALTAAPSLGAPAAPSASGNAFPVAASPLSTVSQTSVTVPDYDTVFPFLKMKAKLRDLLPKSMDGSREGTLAGQELMEFLQTSTTDQTRNPIVGSILAKPATLQWTTADMALRQKLQTDPHVVLNGATAAMTPAIMQEIWRVSDDLRISELHAMALYARAAQPETIAMLEGELERSYVDSVMLESSLTTDIVLGHDTPKAARELFFFERRQCLESVLLMAQQRLRAISDPGGFQLLAASNQIVIAGLVPNLVTLIREWTQMAEQLEKEIHASTPTQSAFGAGRTSTLDTKAKPTFARVHSAFCYQQRQMATECLFFLAYHTQFTPDEVADLVDLVKDLTNGNGADQKSGLPMLDPFCDVPSANHQDTTIPAMPSASPFTSAAPPMSEKDPLEWKAELVNALWQKGGKPQLLQCVSVLVVSVICALDARQELVDRNTSRFNKFGKGNALLPPHTDGGPISTTQLLPVHQRLNPSEQAEKQWRRTDIWGIMVASYALLLPSVMASPRLGSRSPGSPRDGPIDIKSTWWQCLSRPAEFKSFTFARLSLMPAFQKHTGTLDSYEFFMSVLSEFMSQYLDIMFVSGDVPISQAQWERSEEQDLQLRREHQEHNRQFRSWSGTAMVDEEHIPASVDLLNRPDCMDDVMALATAICAAGSAYSRHFWSIHFDETVDGDRVAQLVSSRALQRLELIQENDPTLRPVYVSFLAALALASPPDEGTVNGAAVVNEILLRESTSTKQVTWISLMNAIRWYTREMSPGDYYRAPGTTMKESTATTTAMVQGKASTAYYYGAEDNGTEGSTGYERRQEGSRSTSTLTSARPKEMGEVNNAILLSHLGLIASVAANLPSARSLLVSMKLTVIADDASSVAGEDPVLTVLVLLALAPLTPTVRGAVFATIATLLRLDGVVTAIETDNIKKMAVKAWELVEACRFLPISHLDQFELYPDSSARDAQSMMFPPSSSSLVGDGASGSRLPAESKYGIIFEMEHIESRLGSYPSTEGFLCLLSSLFSAGGSPSWLGKETRVRTGCSPYIEYVLYCVLPRAVGPTETFSSFPFRLPCDRSRLVARALEVVESVVSRYPVPPFAACVPPSAKDLKDHKLALEEATELIGLSDVAEVLVRVADEKDNADFVLDYRDTKVAEHLSKAETDNDGVQVVQRTHSNRNTELSVPRAKSPGFTALADLLSSSRGGSFLALAEVLTGSGAHSGIRAVFGLSQYKQGLVEALFGFTPPSLAVARASQERSASMSKQSLLSVWTPPMDLITNDVNDGVFWREKSISVALRLLCAAAVREDSFLKALSSRGTLLAQSPVLRFAAKTLQVPPLVEKEVQVTKVSSLLVSFASALPSIAQYLRYEGASPEQDSTIAGAALGIVRYICRTLPARDSLSALCGQDTNDRFAQAVALRLYVSSVRAECRANRDRAVLILDLMLGAMRNAPSVEVGMAQVLLGLPLTSAGSLHLGSHVSVHKGRSVRNCLDAVLEVLSDESFLLSPSTSLLASKGFEVICRLSSLSALQESVASQYVASRLASIDFWTQSLLRFLGTSGISERFALASVVENEGVAGQENVLHGVAWLLKGVANELLASHRKTHGLFQVGMHESSYSQKLLAVLFSRQYALVLNLISVLPTAVNRFEEDRLSEVAMGVVQRSRKPMRGAPEVIDGYSVVDESRLRRLWATTNSTEQFKAVLTWARAFNRSASWDCASSHLSAALQTLFESSVFLMDTLAFQQEHSASASSPITPPFDAQMLIEILMKVLFRVVDEKVSSPSTSYSLSLIASLLVERICVVRDSFDARQSGSEGNLIRITSLLSKAVSVTASRKDHSSTVLLGTALGVIVKATHRIFSFEDLRQSVAPAVVALAELARVSPTESDSQSVVMARLCFTILLDVFVDAEDDASTNSSLGELLHLLGQRGLLASLVSLLPSMDVEVCFVLQKFALCSGGSLQLLRARVLPALLDSAAIYTKEERRVSNAYQHQDVSIRTPVFFVAHVCLLTTLIASRDISESQEKLIADETMKCLLVYTPVVSRLFRSFPTDGDILLQCIECFALACESEDLHVLANDDRFSLWEKNILRLTYHLSENPLPRRFLGGIPFPLKSTEVHDQPSQIVSVSSEGTDEESWWDALEATDLVRPDALQLPDPPSLNHWALAGTGLAGSWTDHKYECAIFSLRLLTACLTFVCLRLKTPSRFRVDWLSLARGLLRLTDVARATHGRIHASHDAGASTRRSAAQGLQPIEKQYLVRFGSSVGFCAERLLGIIWMGLHALASGGGDKRMHLEIMSIGLILDHSKMETMGIGCVHLQEDDSNRRNVTKDIAVDARVLLSRLEME